MKSKITKASVKNALYNDKLEPFQYHQNLQNVFGFDEIKRLTETVQKEREFIAWYCASCQSPIQINAMDFEFLREDDYLCPMCKNNIKTKALMFSIMKSSNNLFSHLQNSLYKHYGKKSFLK